MSQKMRYTIVLLLGLLSIGVAFGATAPVTKSIEPPANILFVGNSFTYYNNSLHNHVKALMSAGDKQAGVIRSMTISGARLSQHVFALTAQLQADNWDIVILQGNSMEPIQENRIAAFQDTVLNYSQQISDSGAQPVLFMTWARTDRPEQTALLEAAYTAAGNDAGAFVVPVGLAFEMATVDEKGLALRIADRRHPTLAGTYLAACTFYASLFGESPLGNSYIAGLEPRTAERLQRIAWETVQIYYRSDN